MAKAAPTNEGRRANRRGAARLAAVQALYQMDLAATAAERNPGRVRKPLARPRGRRRAVSAGRSRRSSAMSSSGVVAEQRALDPMIDEALSKGWPLKRIETILRAILRAGAYELDKKRDVPARVMVTEYVDVATPSSSASETGMVNAVLDQLARQLRASEFEPARAETRWAAADQGAVRRRPPDRAVLQAAGDRIRRARARPTMPRCSPRRRAMSWC